MQAEIISIGYELLSGHENTNASWLANQLSANGINVRRICTVGDDKNDIISSLNSAFEYSEIVITTGGLGPTADDVTKKVLCKYFDCNLVFCKSAYDNIEKLFKARGLNVTHINKKQAEIPEKARAIPNISGTAPGLWFDIDGKVLLVMPGVPSEMKMMFESFILPELKLKFKIPKIISRTVLTQGIGESYLSEVISDWEKKIPPQIKLAYLPSPCIVKLRLTVIENDGESFEHIIENLIFELNEIIGEYIYGHDNQKMEEIIGSLLSEKNLTVSFAESCTGGYLSHLLTSNPGSSEYYKGSLIAYANDIKIKELHINSQLIEEFGAVSEEVAIEMASKIKDKFKTDFAVAVTGIAGPDGGTAKKPVGTVWIAVAGKNNVSAQKFLFGENRILNITKASITALNLLRKEIIKYYYEK
ncbi:MAG: competence/damage-inducible protein A [Bacteroidales bacterium]|nr:competence/damage-inducible protein A [Bacteroidales bacterium]